MLLVFIAGFARSAFLSFFFFLKKFCHPYLLSKKNFLYGLHSYIHMCVHMHTFTPKNIPYLIGTSLKAIVCERYILFIMGKFPY